MAILREARALSNRVSYIVLYQVYGHCYLLRKAGGRMIEEIEDWIEYNKCAGQESVFKLLKVEPELEGYYTCRVEGVRYGAFGIYRSDKGYHVTHLNTGGQCGEVFSSENEARRMIFCLLGLTAWNKVTWDEEGNHLDKDLLPIAKEVNDYCHRVEGNYSGLVAKVKELLPIDEDSIEYVTEPVEFGNTDSSKKTKPDSSSSGWGSVVAR